MSKYQINLGHASNVAIGDNVATYTDKDGNTLTNTDGEYMFIQMERELTFNDYQNKSGDTANYPDVGNGELAGLIYPTLGLTNEAGEFAGKIKKLIRDKEGKISLEDRDALGKELGDVLWYISQCASELGLSLRNIAQGNLDKLQSRKQRGTIQGSGDDR